MEDPSRRSASFQIIFEKLVGKGSGLRVDVVAEDAGLVKAEVGLCLISERQTSGEKCVMAYVLNDGELRARNVGCEESGAGVEGNDGIGGASENLNGDGNFCKRIRCEGRAEGGSDGENGAYALVAVGFIALAKRGLQSWIGFEEVAYFGGEAGKLGRIRAHAVGLWGFAKVLGAREFANAAGNFDHRESTKRETGRADAIGVDARAERGIGEHGIEHGGQVSGSFPPDGKSLWSVGLESVIAGMIDRGGDETATG